MGGFPTQGSLTTSSLSPARPKHRRKPCRRCALASSRPRSRPASARRPCRRGTPGSIDQSARWRGRIGNRRNPSR